MLIGFDVISDLDLSPGDTFSWEGKSTSLYCIVAGNISSDLSTVYRTLVHLSKCYQGIFYTAGSLEYEGVDDIPARTKELVTVSQSIRNVAFLHNHVVIVDGVAVMGANGWYGHPTEIDTVDEMRIEGYQFEDLSYLGNSIERLQLHLDVKKIIIVTNAVPGRALYFGENEQNTLNQIPPNMSLANDTESKVTHWVYGNYKKEVDITLDDINYVCNPCFKKTPYWAKRIEISF